MLLLIPCIITVCNQLLFKETVYIADLYPHLCIQVLTHSFIFSFKMSFVYLQHSFHCLINKTVNQIKLSLLISCLSMINVNFINKCLILNKTVKNGKAVIVVDFTWQYSPVI